MLKKITAIMLAVCLMIPAVSSFAASTITINCVQSENHVEIGDEFYADFKVTDNASGYNAMTVYVEYDPNVIQPVECQVDDIPDDLIIYRDYRDIAYSLFSFTNVNSRISFIPSRNDRDYNRLGDGKKTAGEIGIIKLAGYLGATEVVDGRQRMLNYEGTGTLVRFKFKAVGNGSTDIVMRDCEGSFVSDDRAADPLDFDVSNGYITVGDGQPSKPETETTTKSEATETTTSGSSSNSNSGGGGGGSSASNETTTAAEGVTETTTAAPSSGEVTVPSENASKLSFTDVADNFWGKDYIYDMAAKGVVNGYPDSTFRPNNNVTRADFIIMLLRGMGIDITSTPQSNFTDVNAEKYYANAVGIAKDMNIASGNGDGTFSPESNITRQDMMILAKKALELKLGSAITGDASVLDQFGDKAEISAYAVDSLAAMVSEGIVNGMGNNIVPKANTTRVQAVVVISKLMDKIS